MGAERDIVDLWSVSRRFARLRPRSRGQALVELALILPIALVLLASAIDLGRLFYTQITIADAAREGAFEASINPTSYAVGQPCDKVTNRVICRAINESNGAAVGITPADVTMSCDPSCSSGLGNTVTVVVRGRFSLLTPFLSVFVGGTNLTFTSAVSMQIATAPSSAIPTPTPTATPSPSPTPTPTPTPSPTPTPDPSATPTPAPTPTPTPACFAPDASFTVNPVNGTHYRNKNFPGTTFSFTDTSTNTDLPGCNTIWSWNFGDGQGVSSAPNPTYVFSSSNNNPGFLVQLVVSNSAGSSTATFHVVVN